MPELSAITCDFAALHASLSEAFTSPASYTQRQQWFLNQHMSDSNLHNLSRAVRLEGRLDPTILEAAINDIIARHEILRTSFLQERNEPVQFVAANLRIRLARTSLVHLYADAHEAQISRILSEEAQQPFDMCQLPLLRTRLLRLCPVEHILVLTVHPAIFDSCSFTIFLRELAASYTARCRNRITDTPELKIQYRDFATWQRAQFHPGSSSLLTWWKKYLTNIPPAAELPADHPRISAGTAAAQGRSETLALPQGLREKLKELGCNEEATIFMTSLAVFLVLISRYTGKTDQLIGTPSAGRSTAETAKLIGPFANTLLLRCKVHPDFTFRQLLREVRTQVIEVLEHGELPFEKLAEKLWPEAGLNRTPLSQIMFVQERSALNSVQWDGIKLSQQDTVAPITDQDITLYLTETEWGLSARAEYNANLFESATIRRMLAHYAMLLQSAVAHPDLGITVLPMLTEPEKRQLLACGNHTCTQYPAQQTIHGLVSAQVARTPNAIALEACGKKMTYRQLEEESDRLAKQLHMRGVCPGAHVGVCVDRSTTMLTAQKFICNPFSNNIHDYLYRTSDVARRRADGGIELTGNCCSTKQQAITRRHTSQQNLVIA